MPSPAGPTGGPPPRPCMDLSGVDPDYAAESSVALMLAPLTVVHFLALVIVALRLYTKLVLIRTPGRDDWVMLGSLVCTLAGWIMFVLNVYLAGLGRHWTTLTCDEQDMQAQISFYMSVITTTAGMALLKISICLHLLRLSRTKWYSIGLWATICLTVAYQFMGAMTWFFRCIPLRKAWHPEVEGTCYGIDLFITFAVVNTAFNIATDVLCATFPIPIIWGLQMKKKTRFYLIGVLSLGYGAVALGVCKAIFQLAYARLLDKTFEPGVQFWGFLQLNVGIIAACAPTLKPLVSKALGLSSAGGSSYGPGASGYGRSRNTAGQRGNGYGNASGLRSKSDHIELNDMDDDEYTANGQRQMHYGDAKAGATTTFYKGGSDGERSGSEERILGANQQDFKGIIRTTEVIVK